MAQNSQYIQEKLEGKDLFYLPSDKKPRVFLAECKGQEECNGQLRPHYASSLICVSCTLTRAAREKGNDPVIAPSTANVEEFKWMYVPEEVEINKINRLQPSGDLRKIVIHSNPTSERFGWVGLMTGLQGKYYLVTWVLDLKGNVVPDSHEFKEESFRMPAINRIAAHDEVNSKVKRTRSHTKFIQSLEFENTSVAVAHNIAKILLENPAKLQPVKRKVASAHTARTRPVMSAEDAFNTGDENLLGDASEPQTCKTVVIADKKPAPKVRVALAEQPYLNMIVVNTTVGQTRSGWIGKIKELNLKDDKHYARIQWFLAADGKTTVTAESNYNKALFSEPVSSLADTVIPERKSKYIVPVDAANYVLCNFWRKTVGLPTIAEVTRETHVAPTVKEDMEVRLCNSSNDFYAKGTISLVDFSKNMVRVEWASGTSERVSMDKVGVPAPSFAVVKPSNRFFLQPILDESLFKVTIRVPPQLDTQVNIESPEQSNSVTEIHGDVKVGSLEVAPAQFEISMAEAHTELEQELGETVAVVEEKVEPPKYDEYMLRWEDGGEECFEFGTQEQIEAKITWLVEEENFTGKLLKSAIVHQEKIDVELKPSITRKRSEPALIKTRYFATFVQGKFAALIPPVHNNVVPEYKGAGVEVKELTFQEWHDWGEVAERMAIEATVRSVD